MTGSQTLFHMALRCSLLEQTRGRVTETHLTRATAYTTDGDNRAKTRSL